VSETAGLAVHPLWHLVGIVGGAIFYGRFYVQWIASERAGKSVMPIVFWYMSSVGSVLLMAFAVATRSPVGALGQNFNLVVYGRNLIHIWRGEGTLTAWRSAMLHGAVAVVAVVAVGLVVHVWANEIEHARAQPDPVTRQVLFWLGVGVAGQMLFAARFLVQWAATEYKKKSVVPPVFWYLSLAAASLQSASFFHRQEWVFAIGMSATLFIYLRNIWLVRRARAAGGADSGTRAPTG